MTLKRSDINIDAARAKQHMTGEQKQSEIKRVLAEGQQREQEENSLSGQHEKLLEDIPAWKDPSVRVTEKTLMNNYFHEQGYTVEDIGKLSRQQIKGVRTAAIKDAKNTKFDNQAKLAHTMAVQQSGGGKPTPADEVGALLHVLGIK